MDFNFQAAIESLGGENAIARIANEATTPDAYLFNTLLPEENIPDYKVTTGDMEVIATMAGLAGESGPYAPAGKMKISEFLEETAKIANHVELPEGQLRKLQQLVIQGVLQQGSSGNNEILVEEVLNFFNKVILQGHFDTFEWLRSQALVNGKIEWKFNGLELIVDYGIPSGHFISPATGSEAYDKADSTFWTDHRKALELLGYNVRAIIAHTDTILAILSNSANNIRINAMNDDGTVFDIVRLEGTDYRQPSSDRRDQLRLIGYQREGELINPADQSTTIKVPFMPKKKILYVANNTRSGYRVGEGSTPDPEKDRALGYTHIGPTVEAGGVAGRWGRVYTPQNEPYKLVGQGVTNGLPVIEANDKVVVLETEIDGA